MMGQLIWLVMILVIVFVMMIYLQYTIKLGIYCPLQYNINMIISMVVLLHYEKKEEEIEIMVHYVLKMDISRTISLQYYVVHMVWIDVGGVHQFLGCNCYMQELCGIGVSDDKSGHMR